MASLTTTITSFDPLPPAPSPRRGTGERRPSRSARYDAAQTTPENQNHWSNADGLAPNAANSPDVRYRLRNRSRYECGNNGYAGGLVRGRANATIGVCPRLQLVLPEAYTDADFDRDLAVRPDLDRAVELRWSEWADAVGLADKLRLLDKSESRDGEAFGVFITNPALPADGVQLDLKLFEADQVSNPTWDPADPYHVDGIRFDEAGNPVSYDVLRRHPGDSMPWRADPREHDTYPASRVIHLFDPERIGQARGVPATTPGLPLYAILRRYTLASLGAAELGAMIAGVIEDPNTPDDPDEPQGPLIEDMDSVPFARNALLTLTGGKTAKAFDSKNPSPSHREFKGEVLTEAGRGFGATRSTSTGSSAEYNFSSARLDQLPEQLGHRVRRDKIRRVVLDRLFRAWVAEAVLIPGYLPEGLPPASQWRWRWQWDGFGSIDPLKDAKANEVRLLSGQTTLEKVAAESGDDWEEIIEQQARERKLRARLGVPEPGAIPAKDAAPEEEPADA